MLPEFCNFAVFDAVNYIAGLLNLGSLFSV